MTIGTCGRCGADVPGAEVTAVEALTVAGTRLCSVLCPDCVRVMAAGKYPGVFMTSDGKLEAVPSVPAANTCSPDVPCCEACAEFEAEMAAEHARDLERKAAREDRTREALAAYAHEAWAEWMWNQAALQLQMERKGTTVITWTAAEDYDRWARQMRTPYAELPEDEKASDRVQADRILAILRGEG